MWSSIIVLSSFILYANCACKCNETAYVNPEKVGNQAGCIYPEKIGNQPDYYWRNYYGVVPKDAVPGGYDETGNVTYIGQLAVPNIYGIYPGTLYPGQKEAVAVMKKKVVDGTYVKILCSNPANKFEWIDTTVEETHLLTDYHFVVGGSEGKLVSYIGRANFEGQVQVGRVYVISQFGKGLWLLNKEGTETNILSFELLVLPR